MFHSARLKLTAWYLMIIMVISASFSFLVYRQVMNEVRRGLRIHALRLSPGMQIPLPIQIAPDESGSFSIENEIYEEVRKRIILELLTINTGIAIFSALAGYFLAGRTLEPIEAMVEDQKRFTADASHELRTPLTAMKTEIEVALRDGKLTKDDTRKLLVSTLEEVDKMQKLSNYLLTLNRYQDQTTILTREVINLQQVIEEAKKRTGHQAKERNITVNDRSKPLQIRANALSLTELITILIDNAIKYSHPDGEVLLITKRQKNSVVIEVKDSGIGIKSSEIPYIFNRFYRADSSRSKMQVDGFGIGLSIAKNIVQLHNGHIDVESVPEKGSTFRVTLPV